METRALTISDMNCSSCVLHIENDVKALKGVKDIRVNFATAKGEVEFDSEQISLPQIIERIKQTGYTARAEGEHGHHERKHEHHNMEDHSDHAALESKAEVRSKLKKVIFGTVASLIIIALDFLVKIPSEGIISLLLTLAILLYTGREFYLRGIPSFIQQGRPNMDTLVALGISAAFLYSAYNALFLPEAPLYFMDAAIIATFIMLGRYLEAKAKGSASEAIAKLLELSARIAHRIVDKNHTEDVPVDELKKDDTLLVKPGEKIPTDGTILEGHATIDESMVTGESIPAEKGEGSQVIGATVNGNNSFTMQVGKIGKETMLARMIQLVQQAQMSKAPIQKLVDKVSQYFVWAVIIIAIATFVGWYLATGDVPRALIFTVTVLIIACPCALGLATPISIVVGSGKGATMGILIKKMESLERIHRITAVCFDKTGTITKGHPEVSAFEPHNGADEKEVLKIAGSLEAHSEHPLAKSIVDYLKKKEIETTEIRDFKAITGKGVAGNIGGASYEFGSASYITSHHKPSPALQEKIATLHREGHTVLLLADQEKILGIFGVRDTIKETSQEAISRLHARGIKTIMMTGDHASVAEAIAKKVGIDEVLSEVSPEEKTLRIKELREKGEIVAMVGDGINDAPALATADVGIAMGTGTDIAIESGDIVLVQGDLMKAVSAIELSEATLRNIKQNLFWAFIYNTVGIPIAALGFLNPILSAAAMAFSSISVVLNALRLKHFKAS